MEKEYAWQRTSESWVPQRAIGARSRPLHDVAGGREIEVFFLVEDVHSFLPIRDRDELLAFVEEFCPDCLPFNGGSGALFGDTPEVLQRTDLVVVRQRVAFDV